MRETIARIASAQDFHRVASELDEIDLSLFIDHKSNSIGYARFGDIHTVLLRDFAIEKIAEQRERKAETFRKSFLRRSIVRTDSEDLCAGGFKFLHSRLERFHLCRSTTGKRSRKECNHDGALANVVSQMHLASLC